MNIGKNKIISMIILLVFIFTVLPFSTISVNAENIRWKQYLKEFLITSLPSLFDEEAIRKNEEAFEKVWEYRTEWAADMSRIDFDPPIDDFSSDISLRGIRIIVPWVPEFYDLDNDRIPEVIVWHGDHIIGCENGSGWTDIYKLYGTSYEKIKTNDYTGDVYYINTQNKIVVAQIENFIVNFIYYYGSGEDSNKYLDYIEGSINYLEIINKEIVYSEYNNKNKTYEEIFNELKPLPEFDCSDVIDSIKSGTSLNNPKTGDNIMLFYLVFIVGFITFMINLKRKHGLKQ